MEGKKPVPGNRIEVVIIWGKGKEIFHREGPGAAEGDEQNDKEEELF